jgi:exodeoxyribonuclease VII large subunit
VETRKYISLVELQAVVKRSVEAAVPLPLWVAAEIGEIHTNRSGHCYMELVEKGGDNGVPRARVSAVVWRSAWGAIKPYFVSETGSEPAAGMKVLLRVATSYHELYGLSLVVSDIDPVYTLGEQQRQRQETIARLQREGVFDMNSSLEIPSAPQRVAIVSSASAAGYQDFTNEIAGSGFRFDITLFDAVMQGHGAEDSIIEALERVAGGNFDIVVLVRGGGAQSDLAAFDSYRLAAHVAQFPIPIVAGIGHERDLSIVDMVAAVSLKTPTAVAGWLIDRLAQLFSRIETLGILLRERATAALQREKERLDMLARLVESRRPAAILALGFAIARRGGAAITNASALQTGDIIEIEFAHGITKATVNEKEPDIH